MKKFLLSLFFVSSISYALGTIPSPNMGMPVPQVGVEPGPQWATDINNSLQIIDQHDHSPGSGVQITPAGINITTDLTFNSNDATALRSARFTPQGSPLADAADIGAIYVSDVDLYYNDVNGNQVRITQNGSVTGASGSITGLVSPASASYSSGTQTFIWQSNTNVAANMDARCYIFRNSTASSNGLTLCPPTLTSDYNITLPLLPVANYVMQIDASGNISTIGAFDGSTISTTGGVIKVADNGITNTQIADNSINAAKLVNHDVGLLQLETTVLQWNVETITTTVPSFAVRVATTVNGTFATAFDNGSPVDGVTLATSDLILIKNQTASNTNGVYVVQASGAPVRDTAYDTFSELNNASVIVTLGTLNGGSYQFQHLTLASLADPQSWTTNSIEPTFTVPDNVNFLYVVGCGGGGGGGGGGGSSTSNGTGGAGGAGSTPQVVELNVAPALVLTPSLGGGAVGGLGGDNTGTTGATGAGGGSSTLTGTGVDVVFPGSIGGTGGPGGLGGANQTGGAAVGSYTASIGGALSSGVSGKGGNTVGATGGLAGDSAERTIRLGTGAAAGALNSRGGSGGGGGTGYSIGGAGGAAGPTDTDGFAGVDGPANSCSGGGGGGGGGANTQAGGKGGKGANGKIIIYWLGAP